MECWNNSPDGPISSTRAENRSILFPTICTKSIYEEIMKTHPIIGECLMKEFFIHFFNLIMSSYMLC